MTAMGQELEEARARLVTRRAHNVEKWKADPGLLRIARGAYLETDDQWKPWERARMIGLARALWVLQMNPSHLMTMETAALLHGLPLIGSQEQVHIATGRTGGQRRTHVRGRTARSDSDLVIRRYAHGVPDSEISETHGIRVVTRERLMLDMARFRPAQESLPVTDAALRSLTNSSRFRREKAKADAAPIQRRLMERLDEIPGQRGVRRARDVLFYTNPLAESPGESQMRWILLALGLPAPIAQKHVTVQEEHFYPDLWIEILKLGFEYDGLAKYNLDTRDGRSAFMQEKRRDDLLISAGKRPHHLIQEDVATIDAGRKALERCVGADALRRYTPRPLLLAR
nr:hypothetical protein [Actinomycetales bacterium]